MLYVIYPPFIWLYLCSNFLLQVENVVFQIVQRWIISGHLVAHLALQFVDPWWTILYFLELPRNLFMLWTIGLNLLKRLIPLIHSVGKFWRMNLLTLFRSCLFSFSSFRTISSSSLTRAIRFCSLSSSAIAIQTGDSAQAIETWEVKFTFENYFYIFVKLETMLGIWRPIPTTKLINILLVQQRIRI